VLKVFIHEYRAEIGARRALAMCAALQQLVATFLAASVIPVATLYDTASHATDSLCCAASSRFCD